MAELNERSVEAREEVLEELWTAMEQGKEDAVSLAELARRLGEAWHPEAVEDLATEALVARQGDHLRLTDEGYLRARETIRRHRLSERMFHDVLDIHEGDYESPACRFEHLLIKPGLEERICRLLGHPKTCPHGRSIPAGECCSRAEEAGEREVVPLDRLREGERGAIAYVSSTDGERFKKIMAMGVLPGEEVALVRRYPSFVFRVGFSQYAVDEEMAEAIFVRRGGGLP